MPSFHACSSRKIALLTGATHPGMNFASEHRIAQALAERGVMASWVRWDASDAVVDWSSFDAALIRTTWDYVARGADRFVAALQRIGRCTHLLNDPATVERNIDKSYLRALAEAGAPVIETEWIEADGHEIDLIGLLDRRGWHDVVAKPVVGAAASGLLRFGRHEAAADGPASNHVRRLLASHRTVLVQPFLRSVVTQGEVSLLYFDGRYSHAVRKVPKAGDIRVQAEYGATHEPCTPSSGERAAAEAVLDAWVRTQHSDQTSLDATAGPGGGAIPLYARVDLVEAKPGRARLMELELIEPELFLSQAASVGLPAAENLVEALLARVDALTRRRAQGHEEPSRDPACGRAAVAPDAAAR